MSQVSQPQVVAVGVATNISPPSSTPWGAVVIQNLSPYLLEVQAASQTAWLAPFTSDLFVPGQTNAPVAVTPQAVAGVTAAQLLGGAQIQATWFDPTEAQSLAGAYPAALPGSAVLAATSPPGVVFGPTAEVPAGGAVAVNIPIPANARTLLIVLTTTAGAIIRCSVTGNQSNIAYKANETYYLTGAGGLAFPFVVPVSGATDSSVLVAFANVPGATCTVEAWADSTSYKEDVFYNGQAQQVSLGGAGLLLTGPARLLAASVTGTAAGAVLEIGGAFVVESVGGAAPITFPPNTILPANVQFTVAGAGVTSGSLTYAYP